VGRSTPPPGSSIACSPAPTGPLELLPGGKAHAELLTSLEVGGVGAERKTVRLWAVSGINNSPAPIWADANDHFFGLTVGIAWLPEAYAGEQKRMEEVQATAMAAQTAGYAGSLPRFRPERWPSSMCGCSTPTSCAFCPARPWSSTGA